MPLHTGSRQERTASEIREWKACACGRQSSQVSIEAPLAFESCGQYCSRATRVTARCSSRALATEPTLTWSQFFRITSKPAATTTAPARIAAGMLIFDIPPVTITGQSVEGIRLAAAGDQAEV